MKKKLWVVMGLVGLIFFNLAAVEKNIVIGGKFFTEQFLLAEMSKQILEKKGFKVKSKIGLGSNLVRKAQEEGEIDLYWEYTGTSLIAYNKYKGKLNQEQTYQKVKQLDAKKDIIWLKPAQANNTFALAMREEKANQLGIYSISDLVKKYKKEKLKIAVTAEFLGRPDGLKGIEKTYQAKISRSFIRSMDSGLIYNALKDNKVGVGVVFATDGRISAYRLLNLKDDKGLFPDYSMAAVVRKNVLKKHPEIKPLMEKLADALNDRKLQTLNSRVDIDKKSIEEVSRDFIKKNRL